MKQRLNKEERKAAIIHAVLPLFAERGFAAATTKQLARAAAVSEPLLYKHFPSKEDLYNAIQDYTSRSVPPLPGDDLEPSTTSLVALCEQMMRVFILGEPPSSIPWSVRHRLLLHSLLEDGAYARMAYENRFAVFAARLESCVKAAADSGDVATGPISARNLAIFVYQTGVWFAVAKLPPTPALRHDGIGERLVEEATWFALRGIGMRDEVIATLRTEGHIAKRHPAPTARKLTRAPIRSSIQAKAKLS